MKNPQSQAVNKKKTPSPGVLARVWAVEKFTPMEQYPGERRLTIRVPAASRSPWHDSAPRGSAQDTPSPCSGIWLGRFRCSALCGGRSPGRRTGWLPALAVGLVVQADGPDQLQLQRPKPCFSPEALRLNFRFPDA